MASSINAPTTLLPPTAVSSTEDPSLFEQPNDSVHNLKIGGRRRPRSNKRKINKGKKSKRKTAKRTSKKTFLSKWMALGK